MTRACAGALLPGERASFTLPLGACDTHVHLLGPYSCFPLSENRSYTAPEATADDLIALQESLGLQRAVIVNATAYGADSGVMLAALRAYPHRLRGVAVLEPDTTDAELDRLHAAGVRGIRINLYRRNGNIVYRGGTGLESLHALGHRIAERGWHAQIWISVDDLAEVLPRLEACPAAIVFDHMGRIATDRSISDPGFALLCELLKRGPARLSAPRPYVELHIRPIM